MSTQASERQGPQQVPERAWFCPVHAQEFWVPHGGRCPATHCEHELVEYMPVPSGVESEAPPEEGEPCMCRFDGDGALIGAPCGYHDARSLGGRAEPSEAEVERAASAAFFQDDLGGHIRGRWTWDTIPEEGRENYRKMIRAALRAARSEEGDS